MEPNILWQKVLVDIEKEVSKANFLTLFKNTILLSLDNDIAKIAVSSPMIVDMIQKRYQSVIKNALYKLTNKNTELVFSVKSLPNEINKATGPLFAEETPLKKPNFIGHLARVRTEYTFETMAVSSSNQLAFISASTVAKNIGHTYNPLFIYGPVGVGKTHLMQAIANEVYQKDPAKKIIYITSEEFTNEVVESIRSNQTQIMKKKFRTASLLIIDDVQFIAGKDRVQEELFHTFNILIDNGSQIVLSSDKPPHEIKKLEERLSSRFSGGLTVDIETPDFELKTAILLIKAKKYNVVLAPEIAQIIAEKVEDVRSLEGTFLRIITEANTNNNLITKELVLKTLSGRKEKANNRFYPEDVVNKVCTFYNTKPTLIKGPKRDAALVKARQIIMYLLRKELGLTHVEIGNILGGRDHTTIMYGVEKIEGFILTNNKLSEEIMGITKFLRE